MKYKDRKEDKRRSKNHLTKGAFGKNVVRLFYPLDTEIKKEEKKDCIIKVNPVSVGGTATL